MNIKRRTNITINRDTTDSSNPLISQEWSLSRCKLLELSPTERKKFKKLAIFHSDSTKIQSKNNNNSDISKNTLKNFDR